MKQQKWDEMSKDFYENSIYRRTTTLGIFFKNVVSDIVTILRSFKDS